MDIFFTPEKAARGAIFYCQNLKMLIYYKVYLMKEGQPMSLSRKAFFASSLFVLPLSHLINDLSQGAIPVLLPVFKELFDLSYTQIGLLVMVMNFTSSIIQPIFGYFADKTPRLWLIPAGLFGAGLGLSVAKQYVQLMGGGIQVSDREGGGCKIEMRFDAI